MASTRNARQLRLCRWAGALLFLCQPCESAVAQIFRRPESAATSGGQRGNLPIYAGPGETVRQTTFGGIAARGGATTESAVYGGEVFFNVRGQPWQIFAQQIIYNFAFDNDILVSPFVRVDNTKGSATSNAVGGRFFFGDIFHVSVGLEQRLARATLRTRSEISFVEPTISVVRVRTIDLMSAIGATWTWPSGFFIGADAVRLSLPLNSSADANRTPTSQETLDMTSVRLSGENSARAKARSPLAIYGLVSLGVML